MQSEEANQPPKLLPVSPEGIPGALSKAERYRFLNEPWQAESICRDVLAIDPNNVLALTVLGLKFWVPAALGASGDPKGDLERADELESKASAIDRRGACRIVRPRGERRCRRR